MVVALRAVADDARARNAHHKVQLVLRVAVNGVVEAVVDRIQHHQHVRFFQRGNLPVDIHF